MAKVYLNKKRYLQRIPRLFIMLDSNESENMVL